MLEIKSVSFSYQTKKILNDLNLEFKEGEITSVVGNSGVGKSTLFAMLSGKETPQEGAISLNGTDLTKLPASKRPIITMFQQESLFPHMTIYENIKFPLVSKYNKQRFKDIDQDKYINQKLEEVNLAGFADRYPNTLSGGQKQRATLARSLAANPKIILLDEPFSALNEDLKYRLNLELVDIIKQNNIIALKITHDLYEAINFSDKILYLGDNLDVHFNSSDLNSLSAPPEVIEYFQLGILTEDKNTYFPITCFTEDTQEVSFACKVLSSIKRGQVIEYTLVFKSQRFKYYSHKEFVNELILYAQERDQITLA